MRASRCRSAALQPLSDPDLAALALHKAFILNAGPRMFQNLNTLMAILDGQGRPENPADLLAAWQTLFLVVPVVSTTFASVGRMFSGLGRETLGWLLVDEAGQARPRRRTRSAPGAGARQGPGDLHLLPPRRQITAKDAVSQAARPRAGSAVAAIAPREEPADRDPCGG